MTVLEERFENPPRNFSPAPIWWWSGERLDLDRLRWQLDRFAEGGVYNVVVMNLAPTSPEFGSDADNPAFFSEEWWEIFRGVCEHARRIGSRIWFYDQIGFSGTNLQGEIVKERPEFAGQSLERVFRDTSEPLTLECPAGGTPIAAAAMPLDRSGKPAGAPAPLPVRGGGVEWSGEETHRVMLFYTVDRGFDYFSAEACELLRKRVHGAFEERAGDYFGDVIAGSFQDELPSMPTWSENFAREFEERNGYDLLPKLAALWEEYGEEAGRVRGDYHAARAAISESTFFKPLFDWHEERGLLCGFDQQGPARAGYPVESVEFYADYLRTHRWFSAPGSDHHGEAKVHSSLAHLYERPRTWIEAFHSSGWGGTLEETFDWLLPWVRAGANLYDPHAVYYSTRGGWWEWAPPSTDWRQPYWRHYAHFSRTVSRLCSVFTLGHHVADVGVLFPGATVQAGLRLNGPTGCAKAAHEAYLQLVGEMAWFDVKPGILDRAGRDFDVLDEDSIGRARVEEGSLRIGGESYRIIVLPGCTVVEPATASKLANFVEQGGTLVAVGEIPQRAAGSGSSAGVKKLAALFAEHRVHQVGSPEDLARFLKDVPKRVEAPVPTLMRQIDRATVLFVPAAFPRATEVEAGDSSGGLFGESPAGSFEWLDIKYTFDPDSYSKQIPIKVHGVRDVPMLWEPYSGKRRPLQYTVGDSWQEVTVPFDDGPAALVVWQEETGADATEDAFAGWTTVSEETLDDAWTVELEPTLDNRWGDFRYPPGETLPLVELWEFRHRVEEGDEDGVSGGWFDPDLDDSGWTVVHATFGPRGLWTGPAPPETLPSPARASDEARDEWRVAAYSLSRGIYKDVIHRNTLGPKGHVPEEFLDFGRVGSGEAVQFRTAVYLPDALEAHFALGAGAGKRVWINGTEVPIHDGGYLAVVPVSLQQGLNLIEFRLKAEEDTNLRAHFAFVRNPVAYRRPELMRIYGSAIKDSTVSYRKTVCVPFQPERAVLQVGADAPCRVYVNGREAGRQGGFDPYAGRRDIRLQPYDITPHTIEGENEVRIEVSDTGDPHAVLVDGIFEAGGESCLLVSDDTWEAMRDDRRAPLGLCRRQWGDPASSHLRRRPHPLPESGWLENSGGSEGENVIPLLPRAYPERSRAEWLRFTVPPAATRMRLALYGEVAVYLDGREVPGRVLQSDAGEKALEVDLPRCERPAGVCTLRVETEPGREAGAILAAPAGFEMGPGEIQLGDWEEQGLAGYSGVVRYKKKLLISGETEGCHTLLDLGRVRGTVEVFINGSSAGVRIWSPYVFDITGHLRPGENELEVQVFNTLGPFMDANSPTHFVFEGQRVSGLMGPVKLVRASRDPARSEVEVGR